jgi:hypothetical protein
VRVVEVDVAGDAVVRHRRGVRGAAAAAHAGTARGGRAAAGFA